MPLSNFRFFAISYLNDWCCDDSRFVSGLSLHRPKNERLKTLQDAAKYYKVSRTLKTLIGEERLDRALSEVDTSAAKINTTNVDSTVCELAESLQNAYGTYAISAASKFLWLCHQSPVVIYDSRAVQCLDSACEGGLGDCDYAKYRAQWLAQFAKSKHEIQSACAELAHVKVFSLAHTMPERDLTALCGSNWFHERVFDKYLWWNSSD